MPPYVLPPSGGAATLGSGGEGETDALLKLEAGEGRDSRD